MSKARQQQKALAALNYDLFVPESLTPPAPATLYTRIRQQAERDTLARERIPVPPRAERDELPSLSELYRRFDLFNWMYFAGKLPRVRIEYSNRMTAAGSYTPEKKLIKIGRKYHEIFPNDVDDTLKHEMIHIIHFYHDAAFKREAKRIGCMLKARAHPSLKRPPKYLYRCPGCGKEYPRQKRLRMASCGYCSEKGRYDDRFKLRLIESRSAKQSC
ncbi:SprT-like domain-containing protein [bacterium]|nr:SprT-like domain-containing protein [bacterium]MCB2202130.1 SprT-like domain-containing protein [bacterium]